MKQERSKACDANARATSHTATEHDGALPDSELDAIVGGVTAVPIRGQATTTSPAFLLSNLDTVI